MDGACLTGGGPTKHLEVPTPSRPQVGVHTVLMVLGESQSWGQEAGLPPALLVEARTTLHHHQVAGASRKNPCLPTGSWGLCLMLLQSF